MGEVSQPLVLCDTAAERIEQMLREMRAVPQMSRNTKRHASFFSSGKKYFINFSQVFLMLSWTSGKILRCS